MANQELIFNNLAEGIPLGTTELCDILAYDNCDLDAKAKQSLIDQLAKEKTNDARIPAQERRKTIVKMEEVVSVIGSPTEFTFSNTGKNLVSFSVGCTSLKDLIATAPSVVIGEAPNDEYAFTEEFETMGVKAPDGGYLHGDLVVTVPATTVAGDNAVKVVFAYEEI